MFILEDKLILRWPIPIDSLICNSGIISGRKPLNFPTPTQDTGWAYQDGMVTLCKILSKKYSLGGWLIWMLRGDAISSHSEAHFLWYRPPPFKFQPSQWSCNLEWVPHTICASVFPLYRMGVIKISPWMDCCEDEVNYLRKVLWVVPDTSNAARVLPFIIMAYGWPSRRDSLNWSWQVSVTGETQLDANMYIWL